MNDILEEINIAYQELQNLQVQPTKVNITILMRAMRTLENAHAYIIGLAEEKTQEAEQHD